MTDSEFLERIKALRHLAVQRIYAALEEITGGKYTETAGDAIEAVLFVESALALRQMDRKIYSRHLDPAHPERYLAEIRQLSLPRTNETIDLITTTGTQGLRPDRPSR